MNVKQLCIVQASEMLAAPKGQQYYLLLLLLLLFTIYYLLFTIYNIIKNSFLHLTVLYCTYMQYIVQKSKIVILFLRFKILISESFKSES